MIKRLCADDDETLRLIRAATTNSPGHPISNNVTSIPAVRGNRRDYLLTRLHTERPDLYEQVLAGELSPHAAAGLREERKQRIFDMWLACATGEEIAGDVGLTRQAVDTYVEELQKTESFPNVAKLLADFADADFTPPLFNIWSFAKKTNSTAQEFVEAPKPDGLHTTLDLIKRLCADDLETMDLIDRATPGHQGARTDLLYNIQEVPQPKAPTGTSTDRALRALRMHRPDLHAQVLSGELSPHAAAVAAGLRKPTHTIPHDVDAAARALRRHFTADELRALKEQL